ncbi:hypothetical protein LWI28_006405 [Acer negundo]|uniref:Alpha/beta hydrolase fold-3 domain-containing protein n=1 Tax=Acer negundo TaxID=4023 RepID=A0AAD5IDB0_ACENE|nr:hypothetical protein LWI28_006405 [Acer negundo]KAK4837378.1 hypothetical protein QYF36_005005 [Acer negundo]KAK4839379.1 hypothetical protein QYF36_021524 [Acer negundo]
MANETKAQTQSTIDPYKAIHVKPNPDGSITRTNNNWPKTPATPDPPHHIQVLSKDVVVNQSNNVWVRIFLPREALDQSSSSKLPLIVYYHGGGFVICSADIVNFHNFCFDIAKKLQAVVVSVEYRLAPENRLPAAYDDAMETLHWIRDTKDEWLTKYVDFSKCFLMGSSAGGNIAYHAGLRGALEVDDLLPIKIQGLILHQPFFGGVKRCESELRLLNDIILPLCVTDLLWNLSLPIGADRNHEYSNPTVEGGTLRVLDQIKRLGWKVMVTGCDGDPLIERQIEVVKLMEEKGVKVMSHFALGGFHGVEFTDPSRAEAVISQVKDFVFSSN